jgi:hypothetical protein
MGWGCIFAAQTNTTHTMDKQVWKYVLDYGNLILSMPKGAEILTVQTQGDDPVLWALVDPNADKEERYFEAFGTGHNVACGMGIDRKYISTFQIEGYVFHVFERIN